MTLYESVTVLAIGGDFLYTLEEAGLSTGFIALLVLLLAAVCAAGCVLYRFMPQMVSRKRGIIMLPLFLFIAPAAVFICEQSAHRDDPGFFWRRVYPLYIELYSANSQTMNFKISPENRATPEEYGRAAGAANPGNVVFIILESFRSDSINRELAPDMYALAGSSFASSNYYTGGIYTSLAWNSLLMDRPAYTYPLDIDYDSMHRPGSGILRIFKNSGYETYCAFSANMEWKGFHERVNGRDRLIDHYFCGYRDRAEERNHPDRRVAAQAVEWIRNARGGKPFVMLLHLDSTHWTYYSDPENRLSKPYAGKDVNYGRLRTAGDIELLYNRYKNSVRQVNSGISRVIAALRDSGRYNNTAIVIVSDHGEGFAPGMIGHSVMHDDIKKPAFIMYLPGAGRFKRGAFITDAEIFPTIFDYLRIKGWRGLMRGRSLLDPDYKRECVLSFHGSLLMADLTFNDYRVMFRVRRDCESISFTPVYFTDSAGRIIPSQGGGEWRDALCDIISDQVPLTRPAMSSAK